MLQPTHQGHRSPSLVERMDWLAWAMYCSGKEAVAPLLDSRCDARSCFAVLTAFLFALSISRAGALLRMNDEWTLAAAGEWDGRSCELAG